MTNLAALEREVEKLNPEQLTVFLEWLTKYYSQRDVGARRDVGRDSGLFTELVDAHVLRKLAEYGFAQHEAQFLDPGLWVTLRNTTTEVSVYFEYGTGVMIAIHSLDPATATHTGQNFGLDDLLWVRAPHLVRRFRARDFIARLIASELEQASVALSHYADDVLRGNFAIYEILKPILDDRRIRAEQDFWKVDA